MEKYSLDSFRSFREKGFAKINIYRDQNTNIFTLNLLPGQRMPEHYHYGGQLIFHVLQGTGIFIIDGNSIEVKKDDILHVQGTEKVGFENNGDEQVTIYVSLFGSGRC